MSQQQTQVYFAPKQCWPFYSRFQVNHQDLSTDYAGTLMGISNTVANIPGVLAPYYVGAITNGNVRVNGIFKTLFLKHFPLTFTANHSSLAHRVPDGHRHQRRRQRVLRVLCQNRHSTVELLQMTETINSASIYSQT
jgi:hypothetical protein